MKKLALSLALFAATFIASSTNIISANAETINSTSNKKEVSEAKVAARASTWQSYVTHSDVRLRAEPNTHSTVKRLLQKGDPVTVYGYDTVDADGYTWLHISYKGIYGYVPQNYIYG